MPAARGILCYNSFSSKGGRRRKGASAELSMMPGGKQKLQFLVAVATLLLLAIAVGCSGFFVNPTLTSITISPTAPQVQVGKTVNLQAFGTYDDGSRKLITSGLGWSSDDPTVAAINQTSGVLTGVAIGTTTVTADAQGLSGTASATVLLTGVTNITVSPTTGAVTKGSGTGFAFNFTATANGVQVPLTTDSGADLTITPATSDVTCEVSGDSEVCSADLNAVSGNYTLTMTYPGSAASAIATLTVN